MPRIFDNIDLPLLVRAGKIIDVESVAIMDGNFGCDGQCGVE